MDFKSLRNNLAEMAKNNEICNEWYQQLKTAPDMDAILEMYIKGIDFCFSNEFPSNAFIRRYFKGKMEHKHIYLDETVFLENTRDVICLGDTRINFLANQYAVSQIYIKDNCKGKIVVKDFAFVTIDLFDNSEIEIEASGESKVVVNVYKGAKVNVKELDKTYTKVSYKQTKTYV